MGYTDAEDLGVPNGVGNGDFLGVQYEIWRSFPIASEPFSETAGSF